MRSCNSSSDNDLFAVSHMLKDLKHRFSQGLLTEKEFKKAFDKYHNELERIRKAAGQARNQLREENVREDTITKPKAPKRKAKAKKKSKK